MFEIFYKCIFFVAAVRVKINEEFLKHKDVKNEEAITEVGSVLIIYICTAVRIYHKLIIIKHTV